MTEEWGPWIEHDGKGCPCVGQYMHAEYERETTNWRGPSDFVRDGKFSWGVARGGKSWIAGSGWNPVVRYRIRKPRALIQLIDMVENLPAPTERVEA